MATYPRVYTHSHSPDTYELFGVELKVLLSSKDTYGQFCIVEGTMPPGADGGLHIHVNEDESMHLFEGELEVTIGQHVFTLHAGESYFAPRNVQQRLRNIGKVPARALVVGTPGGFDQFVMAAGTPLIPGVPRDTTPPTPERMQQILVLAQQHGIRLLPDAPKATS
ncbi:cupin domain-containing protein [Pseudomonas sp. NPDC089554]|uniref:cupin domain-containing protein n=1 Tax=Pseudomonas sp. NPDC089554 TaxID=3390653 RepID=UPI003D05646E